MNKKVIGGVFPRVAAALLPTMTREYSDISGTAKSVQGRVLDSVEASLHAMEAVIRAIPQQGEFVVAEYGCADGVNSEEIMKTIVRRVTGFRPDIKVKILYVDLAGREAFDAFWRCSSLAHMEGIATPIFYPHQSFYKRLDEYRDKVHFMYTSTATHWLDTTDDPQGLFTGHSVIQPNQMGSSDRARYVEKWKKDWTKFMHARTMELVPGGRGVFMNLCDLGGCNWPASLGYNYLRASCENVLSREEVIKIFIPNYFPTPEEFRSSFTVDSSLSLVRLQEVVMQCAYYKETKSDVVAMAKQLASVVEAWSRSSLEGCLGAQEKDVVDLVYARLAENFERELGPLDYQYCLMEVEKRSAVR